jgi:plasmid replication initiation protein
LPEREQLDLFRALPGDMAPRDSQDLMAFPFFSLAKSRRTAPIDFRAGGITIRVEGTQEHGIATIWDADVLIGPPRRSWKRATRACARRG